MSTPPLEGLLALQDLDASLDRLRHRLQTLPERAELAGLEARQAQLAARRAEAAATRDEAAGREQVLEGELAASERRMREIERRMYSGQVSASRELQAMSEEVEALRARASTLEDRALEVLAEREPLDAVVEGLDAELGQLAQAAEEVRGRLEVSARLVEREIGGVEGERRQAVGEVPAELLPEYDRLRRRLGGVAVARLVGDRCDGCHLSLPATELQYVRRQPPDAVVTCDNCGRILVRA